MEWTSIRISKGLKEELARIGSFGESYEVVIRKLLDSYCERTGKKKAIRK